MKRTHGKLITVGSFDGVHCGHQELFRLVTLEAKKRKLKSLAITFKVPPRVVLNQDPHMMILSDPLEKELLIRRQKLDDVDVLAFGKKISQLKPFLFFRDQLINRYNAKGLVVGYDFRFGADRSAGALELVRWGLEYEIPVWVVPPVRWKRKVVSSSFIRGMLEAGRFQKALEFLGHPYLVCGKIVKGKGNGNKIGFPTANISFQKNKCLPRGVFAVMAAVSETAEGLLRSSKTKQFKGVCNIGYRPTIGSSTRLSVEVHLFGHPAVKRGDTMAVELIRRIRGEKKFSSLNQLRRAIQKDVATARRLLSSRHQ